MTQLSQIKGISTSTIEKLNALNITNVNDLKNISPEKLVKISHIGTSKIVTLYSAAGIPLNTKEIENLNRLTPNNKISQSKPIQIKINPHKLEYTYNELSEKGKEKVRNSELSWDDSGIIKEEFEHYLEERGLPTDKIYYSLSYSQGDGVFFGGDIDWKKFKKYFNIDVSNIDKICKKIPYDSNYDKIKTYSADLIFEETDFVIKLSNRGDSMYLEVEDYWIISDMETELQEMAEKLTEEDESDDDWDDVYDKNYEKLIEETGFKNINDLLNEIEVEFNEIIQDVAKELEKIGYKEIEYLSSDEYIKELCEVNEYKFDKEGNLL